MEYARHARQRISEFCTNQIYYCKKKGETLRVSDLQVDIDSLYMHADNNTLIINKEGNIKAHVTNGSFAPAMQNGPAAWSGHLVSLSTHHLQYNKSGDKPMRLYCTMPNSIVFC